MATKIEKDGNTTYLCGERQVEQVVVDNITSSFKDAEGILADLKWDSLNKNYYFNRWGMYIGIEPNDGYIHS